PVRARVGARGPGLVLAAAARRGGERRVDPGHVAAGRERAARRGAAHRPRHSRRPRPRRRRQQPAHLRSGRLLRRPRAAAAGRTRRPARAASGSPRSSFGPTRAAAPALILFRAMTPLLLAAMLPVAPAELVPPSPPPAAASGASGSIDPAAATRAYLDQLPPDQRARSDAYFEGGYWLQLWTFLWAAAIFVLLLHTGVSAKMRDLAARATAVRALQTALYWSQFVIAVAVLSFPLSVYSDFIREHRYGLSNLSFGAWIGEELKGLAISIVLGAFAMMALYAIVRRLPRTWWIWGAAVTIAFAAFAAP